MDLNRALATFDKVAVNLEKLEKVWNRAQPFVPDGPHVGSSPEYNNLARTWDDLLPGLLPIEGWTITNSLPDIDALGQDFLDYAELGELPRGAWEEAQRPSNELAKYRYLLDRARRKVIASRLTELSEEVSSLIGAVLSELPTLDDWIKSSLPQGRIEKPQVEVIESSVAEIERLLGQTVARRGRWNDLHRHLHFGEVNDWYDISNLDWPSVLKDIEAAKFGQSDPIEVPHVDLGEISKSGLTGQATTALDWSAMDAEGFERLLFDILQDLDGYQNVDWLMKTNAPDRGRDISLQRVIPDSSGTVRTERVIVQAKHYTSKSVGPNDISSSLSSLSMWEPPVIRSLVIATSSRFSSDAVAIAERHNENGNRPQIELWADSKLETLLSQRPKLAIMHGLRS